MNSLASDTAATTAQGFASISLGVLSLVLSAPYCVADQRESDTQPTSANIADSPAHEARKLAQWFNKRGEQAWGQVPAQCTDLEFARRVFLDLVGRVPSVSEIRDFESIENDKRRHLVEQLLFENRSNSSADRATFRRSTVSAAKANEQTVEPLGGSLRDYRRLTSSQMARHWSRVLSPEINGPQAGVLREWLQLQFQQNHPYDEMMRPLVELDSTSGPPQYYGAVAQSPVEYAGTVARSLLGVRIECAQCHDHPFADWRQEDFWGMAAFYTNVQVAVDSPGGVGPRESPSQQPVASITTEGKQYFAKVLWSDELVSASPIEARKQLSSWLCSADNEYFTSNAANRFWQYLVGRGLYPDVENLDQASDLEREFMREAGQKFASVDFDVRIFIAGICESQWYQAKSAAEPSSSSDFYRPMKTASPSQIFDSLEQSLHLPIGRADLESPRWSGAMQRLVLRLEEAASDAPDEFVSGIPQALAIMNGEITSAATELASGRLLRAVVESPFFDTEERIEVIFLAVLSRRPSAEESEKLVALVESSFENDGESQDQVLSSQAGNAIYGEILWALINSPEFVLCR